ncbi:MAG TPA: tRNA uridine-5-carboxymethylaminomethyl(34) synthesis enzyme MnmG [Anaerohalosphaeraceae bacterium]|jgi:tRNA uridine 5-carboxymethylaminomethyl modification enzyme|nr:tRNA uridine-5-carboxymethylaminomethyl(34) synthesis enzyme MnmG [Anaerohalosphaeraceae bacterium]HRT51676.1 tRNA uridine-5-carboxymethylaminomethyl(34) synthesis enzyme MnmG [Anaerohalosphaeraceae bacterium]HRT87365.1 tRNA uridine-5-carboxymethylaminomethyl(34) synthesis enzyme MnmG [Anaerohalosphaeraceae bacterium]
MKTHAFDCIVIGGGHAGAEAAWAASRLGAKTLLITMSRDTIAKMSCNPAIGGLAKGQIVREIDALGGLMALATDAAGIQFRLLNRSKGPAVQSPRAQTDKYKYKDFIRNTLEQADNLTIHEGVAADILTKDSAVTGVACLDGTQFAAPTVIVTAGTFLRGIMHIGPRQRPGGRLDEPASNELSESLRRLGLTISRLKTGTPPRLDAATVDFDEVDLQPGDDNPLPFSFLTDRICRPQTPCWITWTNPAIHDLLRANLHRAPMYTGQITATGARYCPSIETKIVRFADKDRHQVFLEPEDEAVTTIYCNGISTSYPEDVQHQMLALLPGARRARIVHYAYAIEYDYCPAMQLQANLETHAVAGLFLAGQVNGTSGYEEAAAQGLVAGVNAVRKLAGAEPLILGRDQAYIGVLIDDLRTRRIDEPYRMFTSRAEYRLSLRSDNADRRLTQIGRSVGLVDDRRWDAFCRKVRRIEQFSRFLKETRRDGKSLWQWLKQPDCPVDQILADPAITAMRLPQDVLEAACIDAKYEGYLVRQQQQIAAFRNLENIKLPRDLDYQTISHLRFEAREKLTAFQPHTLGQASRIGGITPADITVIQIHLKKSRPNNKGSR